MRYLKVHVTQVWGSLNESSTHALIIPDDVSTAGEVLSFITREFSHYGLPKLVQSYKGGMNVTFRDWLAILVYWKEVLWDEYKEVKGLIKLS